MENERGENYLISNLTIFSFHIFLGSLMKVEYGKRYRGDDRMFRFSRMNQYLFESTQRR